MCSEYFERGYCLICTNVLHVYSSIRVTPYGVEVPYTVESNKEMIVNLGTKYKFLGADVNVNP